MPNSFTNGVGTFFSASNDHTANNESGVQYLGIDLNNTYDDASKQVLTQFYQSYAKRTSNVLGSFSDLSLNQRFVFGAWVINPLEFNSKKTADVSGGTATGISSIKANNFVSYSDVRLKTHIETLNENQGVDKIRVVQYKSVNDHSKHFGVIAHELEEIYPELVLGEKGNSEMQSVSYVELIPLCINEIQTLKKENCLLRDRLDALEKKRI